MKFIFYFKNFLIYILFSLLLSAFGIYMYYFHSKSVMLHNIMLDVCLIIAVACFGFCVHRLYCYIFKYPLPMPGKLINELLEHKYGILFAPMSLAAALIYIFTSSYFSDFIGYKNLYHETTGSTCAYYVKVKSRNGETYTLPAKILVDVHDAYGERYFMVESVYFDDDSYLYFDDAELFNTKDYTRALDQNERRWKLKLTEKPVKNPPFETYKKSSKYDFLYVLLISFLCILLSILWFKHVNCYKKDVF